MKHSFDNAGVATVQAALLSLPTNERDLELQAIRDDFRTWMVAHFDLSASQLQQLDDMPAAFRQHVADHIANTWASGSLIAFFKEATVSARHDEPRDKDFIIFPQKRQVYNMDSHTLDEETGLDIRILYRD